MVNRMAFLGRGNGGEAAAVPMAGKPPLQWQQFYGQGFQVLYVEWEAESEEQARRDVMARLVEHPDREPVGLYGGGFAPMERIFSYNRPQDAAHWRRKAPGTACGSLAKIRPGMLGSYAYYHHILQETTVRVRDKYGAIFVLGDILFYYREQPGEQEFPWYRGQVQGTVPENWGELMRAHFGAWEDGAPGWRAMEGGGPVCVTG